jgi:DNA recombination protein RmuC
VARQADEQAAALRVLENPRGRSRRSRPTKARKTALMQKIAEQGAELPTVQDRLPTEFENIANRNLRANATELSDSSQKALAMMLDPLRERIEDFRQRVEATYEAETREVPSLKEQIELVMETSQAVCAKPMASRRHCGGFAASRPLGELSLERILEAAGLTAGREYVSQGRGLGLRNEAGGAQRPDVVIMLPERRTMIIDSKVPPAGYERLIAAC